MTEHRKLTKDPASLLLLMLVCLLIFFIALFTDGTADAGDSINHFLFSKYAFRYPQLFLDLWNKPVFTLLSAPFAQAGLTGIKVFNALCGCASAWLVYRISLFYSSRNNFFILLLFSASAFHFVILNSGLTEPLFEAALLAGILLFLRGQKKSAAFIFSLLPFIRQEGYLLLVLLLFYLLLNKEWKATLLLLAGHIAVSLAGIFYTHDLLWVFKNNPNAFYSHYGHGGWLDYFHKLAYILGKPLYFFLAAGILFFLYSFFTEKHKLRFLLEPKSLPLYCFLTIVIAHTVFWRFGLFKSMGMERNIITVYGCAVIIAFTAVNFLLEKLQHKGVKTAVAALCAALLLSYPFFPDPKKVNIPGDFALSEEQELIQRAATATKPFLNTHTLRCSHPWANYLLERDPFDSVRNPGIHLLYPRMNSREKIVVLWDGWISTQECGVGLWELERDTSLRKHFYAEAGKYKSAVFVSR